MSSPLLVLERTVELCRALDRAGVPHAVGGALALAFHVRDPRATNDIDVNITADPQDPEPVFKALPEGVQWSADDVARVSRDGQVRLWWGEGVTRTPLDLFFPQHELHAVLGRRVERVPLLDAQVPILSATDLTVFKALFDRTKDWADIEELLAYGQVEVDEVRSWLVRIVGAQDRRLTRLDDALAAASEEEATTRRLFER